MHHQKAKSPGKDPKKKPCRHVAATLLNSLPPPSHFLSLHHQDNVFPLLCSLYVRGQPASVCGYAATLPLAPHLDVACLQHQQRAQRLAQEGQARSVDQRAVAAQQQAQLRARRQQAQVLPA